MKTLKHIINTLDSEGNKLEIEIKLHGTEYPYFSVTGTAWKRGKAKIDRNIVYAGSCHEDIIKVRPDLQIFVYLHLSNSKGIPMHAVDNGFYFLINNGYGSAVFMEHMRIGPETAILFKDCKDKNHFLYILCKSGIIYSWEFQANIAIKILENLTGETFQEWGKLRPIFKDDFNFQSVEERFSAMCSADVKTCTNSIKRNKDEILRNI